MMNNPTLERLCAHRNNIHRYQRLLATRLSDLERTYIERRLKEERACVEALMHETLPDRLSVQSGATPGRGRTTNLDLNALLHPADAFIHPMDVVEDCDLTSHEKRAILSSWAANVCAVRDASELNRSSHEGAVSFDDILDALCVLDSDGKPSADPREGRASPSFRHSGEASPRWNC